MKRNSYKLNYSEKSSLKVIVKTWKLFVGIIHNNVPSLSKRIKINQQIDHKLDSSKSKHF